jgi:hypothetical protein
LFHLSAKSDRLLGQLINADRIQFSVDTAPQSHRKSGIIVRDLLLPMAPTAFEGPLIQTTRLIV